MSALTPRRPLLWLSAAAMLAAAPAVAEREVLAPEHTAGVDLLDEEAIAAGRETFSGLCTGYCHGAAGTAKRSPSLRNRHDLNEATIFHIIANGRSRAGNPMPAWKDFLDEEQMWELVAYIVSLRDAPPLGASAAGAEADEAATN